MRTWGALSGEQLAFNSTGEVIVYGIFTGKCDFDPGPGESILTAMLSDYINCFDLDGNFKWVQAWGDFGGKTGGLSDFFEMR